MNKPENPSKKSKGGRPRFVKDPAVSQLVELHTAMGTPEDELSEIVKIPIRTLTKHFRDELRLGHAKANAKVAARLYKKALDGDNACMIFWLKTRAGWRETNNVNHFGTVGLKRVDDLTEEELLAIATTNRD